MKKFLLLFFASLCSLILLGAWALDDDTEDIFVGFWYYDNNASLMTCHTICIDEAFSIAFHL